MLKLTVVRRDEIVSWGGAFLADYAMRLSDDERSVLAGDKGETLRKALETVVRYGEVFGADSLADVEKPVHLVTSFGVPL